MYIDALTRFSSSQAVTVSAASTNVLDGVAAGNAYDSAPWFVARVAAAFAGGTSLTIAIQTAADEAFQSPVTLFSSGALLLASLTASTEVVKVRFPLGAQEFVRVYYTVDTAMTAGTIDAFLAADVYVPFG